MEETSGNYERIKSQRHTSVLKTFHSLENIHEPADKYLCSWITVESRRGSRKSGYFKKDIYR